MQKGQAIVEALVVIVALAAVFIAIIWLGNLQNVALQLSNTSRDLAFKYAYQGLDAHIDNNLENQMGLMRDGSNLVQSVRAKKEYKKLNLGVNLGKFNMEIMPIFTELNFGDNQISIHAVNTVTGVLDRANGLADFDKRKLSINRYTAILSGNGAAENDLYIQNNLANSNSLWRDKAKSSIAVGKRVKDKLQAVDQAWGRALPQWDWISPWSSWVPAKHIKNWDIHAK